MFIKCFVIVYYELMYIYFIIDRLENTRNNIDVYVNVHSHVRILLLIRLFAVITKYTVLDEQRREAKEGKSQRKKSRSITRGANLLIS